MLLKKTAWFWKSGLAAISFMLIVSVSGCSDTPQEETAVVETISEVQLPGQKDEEETEKMIECCLELYEKAAEENKIADLEMIRSIVNRFGENGYPAVDSRNQIDMTEAEQVERFCEMVDTQEEAEITLTLTANVVFPYVGDSKVYAHEVVVRPLENGEVQYVSNRIIPSEDNCEETWHTPRLTAKEWDEIYGGK